MTQPYRFQPYPLTQSANPGTGRRLSIRVALLIFGCAFAVSFAAAPLAMQVFSAVFQRY